MMSVKKEQSAPSNEHVLSDHGTLRRILDANGDACYVMDEQRYADNITGLLELFGAHYGRIAVGHSYKTNYIPQLCLVAHNSGAYAEVVSQMEYDLAIRLGIAPERIILNGPVKDDALLRDALFAGVMLNVDSMGEADRVMAIAQAHPERSFGMGARLNFRMEGLRRSRFGIDTDGDAPERLLAALEEVPNLRLRGIHCHLGGDRTGQAYAHRTERMMELARRLFPNGNPDYIDIGGGFAGQMPSSLAAQLPYPPPSMAEYATAVAGTMARSFDPSNGPELIVEPGMSILSDVLHFVCEVSSLKEVAGEHHAITTGSIYNIKPTLHKMDMPIEVVPVPGGKGRKARWVISGYTCMEIDVMHAALETALAPNDLLVCSNVGAYTVVLKPPFIKPAPAIVSVQKDGSFSVVKRAETLDDILATYRWQAPNI